MHRAARNDAHDVIDTAYFPPSKQQLYRMKNALRYSSSSHPVQYGSTKKGLYMKVERPASFIRLPKVQQRVPFSKSSIYGMIANGKFPAPHRIGARAVGWLEHEVDEWVRARIEAPPPIPAAPRPVARTRAQRMKMAG
jgi:prophage regulatory protein